MPRYFFNIYDHQRDIDAEGVELAGPEAATTAAVVFAGDLLSDTPALLADDRKLRIEVRDASGQVLATVIIALEC